MTHVLIISDTPDWCFAQRVRALERYAPPDIRFTTVTGVSQTLRSIPFCRYDVVLLLRPDLAGEVQGLLTGRVPLIGCYNSGVGRAGHSLPEAMVACDWVIVNNYAAWSEWRGRCRDFNACNISNGVDLETFHSTVPMHARSKRVLWTAGADKSHAEEDVKGYRGIASVLERVLPAKGFGSDIRVVTDAGLPADRMAEWYNGGSVYVVTSRSEGTPNVLLEAMACGCAVVTSDVGNVPEIISHGHNGLIVRDRQTIPFLEAIQEAFDRREELSASALNSIRDWGWESRVRWYYAVIRRIAANERPRSFTWLDTDPEEV